MKKESRFRRVIRKYYNSILYVGIVSIADIVLLIMPNYTLMEEVMVLLTFINLSFYMMVIIMSKEGEDW